MKSVFTNLFYNSFYALEEIENPQLDIEVIEKSGDIVQIRISDNGAGIPQDIRGKIFSPFFTTKDPGKGKGFGLAICYKYVREHRGNIYLADRNGSGTTFVIDLPKTTNY